MLAFSVLTPYYSEEVIFSTKALKEENEDGISIIFYLQKIFPGTQLLQRII
jgi:callose synthase